jgi:hypothetical protein
MNENKSLIDTLMDLSKKDRVKAINTMTDKERKAFLKEIVNVFEGHLNRKQEGKV